MKHHLNKIWQEILICNKAFFPLIVICFITFALIEEFLPGFFTFYFNENWVIGIVVISSILMLFNKEELHLVLAQKQNTKFSIFLWIIFVILFIGVVIYKTWELYLIFKILLIPITTFMFAVFSFAIIFPTNEEQEKLLKPFKTDHFRNAVKKTLFYFFFGLVIFILLALIYLAITDPIYLTELFDKIKNIDVKGLFTIEKLDSEALPDDFLN